MATRGPLACVLAPCVALAAMAALPVAVLAKPSSVGVESSARPHGARQRAALDAVEQWLAAAASQPASATRVRRAWAEAIAKAPNASRLGPELLRLAAEVDERVASLAPEPPDEVPRWFMREEQAATSLRLAIAERLAAWRRYDACLAWCDGLEPESTYSPALVHYLRAIAARQTVADSAAGDALALIDEADEAALGSARAWVVAALRKSEADEPGKLPTISRRMGDVGRRLEVDAPGALTERRQQQIVDDLDRLIEDLEEQRRRQQQQAQGRGGGAGESSTPIEQSLPAELKGPGEVDRKRLVAGDAWGALPPAERERLTQALQRGYPERYRRLVEAYFQELADGDADPDGTTE